MAALPKCNAVRKGQIVGNRVCSVQKGTYRWVKVVAPAPTPAPVASQPAPSGQASLSEVPAGFTRHSAIDGSWSVVVPGNWRSTDLASVLQPIEGLGTLFTSPDSEYTFTIKAFLRISNPTDDLATDVAAIKSAGYEKIIDQGVSSLNGLPMYSVTTNSVKQPDAFTRAITVYRPLQKNDDRGSVRVTAEWRNGKPESTERKAQLNAILASVTVTP
jgi:hypothetical protein